MCCRSSQWGLCLAALGTGMLVSQLLGTCLAVILGIFAVVMGLLIMKRY